MNDKMNAPIDDRRAWRGAELPHDADWVTTLTAEQIDGLYAAADALPGSSEDWQSTNRGQFQADSTTNLFTYAGAELANGRGFVLFRGLDGTDSERLRRAFWVIGNGLGAPVMQNARGEILSIVADRFAGAERGTDTRGYESNDELRFHCDGGDCIGMSCVRQAPKGGTNGLVSLFSIYNQILRECPEHLETLAQGYPLYARKEPGDEAATKQLGKVNPRRIPVFAWERGRMSAWLNILLAELAAQMSGLEYTDAEHAALACVEQIAMRPEMQITFKQQPGDVLFINNHAVMHRREKYADSADPAAQRMLYRMWINLHDAQPVVREHAALRRGIRGPAPIIAA